MTISAIAELCRGFLATLPDPGIAVRPTDGDPSPPDARSIWMFLSRMEVESRDQLDPVLGSKLLDLNPAVLSPVQQFWLRNRTQSAVYHLSLLAGTLRPHTDLRHTATDPNYALEWALVGFWNFCRFQWLARVARCLAAGMTDPLAHIPSEFPDWFPPDKRR